MLDLCMDCDVTSVTQLLPPDILSNPRSVRPISWPLPVEAGTGVATHAKRARELRQCKRGRKSWKRDSERALSVEDGDFAGDYSECRKVREWTSLEPGGSVEHKWYCKDGPGLVLIEGIGGGQTEQEVLMRATP